MFLAATLMILAAPHAALAQGEQWQVGTSPSFSTGRYGTETRTEVLHTPITARRLFTDGDLTVVFPWTCIRGNGAVTVVGGSPVRTDVAGERAAAAEAAAAGGTTRAGGTTTGRTGATGNTGGTSASTASTTTATTAAVSTACGMGDIIVRGRYYVVDERRWLPTIALRAHVKTPTADADEGLGTGRPDEGIGIEISRTFERGTTLMVDGGYTVIGQPAGVDFNNTWWYDVGLGQDIAGGVLNLSVFFEEYSAIVPGLASARDILASLTIKGAGGWRIQISSEFGLSDGAPDHGLMLGASRRF
jgi:hypothetical protein